MEKMIEELIEEKINDWDDCLNRHYAGEKQNSDVLIRAALSDMQQLKSSLPTQATEEECEKLSKSLKDYSELSDKVGTLGNLTGKTIDALIDHVKVNGLPTQQDKVVVPEFVARYIAFCKSKNWELTATATTSNALYYESRLGPSGLNDWIVSNYATFLIAIATDDYTVEKEQIYEVVFYEDESDRWLLTQLGENSYEIIPESKNDGYRTQWFTEEKIKAINEKYWGFRHPMDKQCQMFTVPVEEDEI
ncbi:DUF1642 domain-containing protein [Enterococcus plantarum]|nr:DUF1642 domain-containing protein [Enterococcus plantarum]